MNYVEYAIHSDDLLCRIAPIAMQQSVYKELGYPVYSDDMHTWFLAYENERIIGFCAAIDKLSHYQFSHDYVIPSKRGNGFYLMMFEARDIFATGADCKATCTAMSWPLYRKKGFKMARATKNYTFALREV